MHTLHQTITAHNARVSHARHALTRTILYTALISSLATLFIVAIIIDITIIK